MPRTFITIILLCSLIIISGCSGRLFTVYKIDIQQGNAVEPDKVAQLEIGMTKEQVKYLMGTPLVLDIFHPDRWDYVYHLIPDNGEKERRHLAVFFEGDTVSNIEKSDIPEPVSEETSEQSDSEDT